jgi:hypothetical protein
MTTHPRTSRYTLIVTAAFTAGVPFDWAVHHRLGGWQAMSWPAEIDVFLAVGELALYVAYLDGWPARQRAWPWATALTGLAVSVAGNIGHIQAGPGHPVILADRLTAATSPLAAFAGLSVGLLVLKMTRQQATASNQASTPTLALAPAPVSAGRLARSAADAAPVPWPGGEPAGSDDHGGAEPEPALLHAASVIYQDAAARGERLSQRMLARQLRGHGHRFPNERLRQIADSIGLTTGQAA